MKNRQVNKLLRFVRTSAILHSNQTKKKEEKTKANNKNSKTHISLTKRSLSEQIKHPLKQKSKE